MKPLTWLDVQHALLQERTSWPPELLDVHGYFDGLRLATKPGSQTAIDSWLQSTFNGWYDATNREFRLESLPGAPRILPVELAEEQSPGSPTPMPRFDRLDQLPGTHPPELPTDSPPIIAFYSFKGGVGRTLHMVALWKVLASRGDSVLVVDGDLEAPGLTWLVRGATDNETTQVAYLDFLTLVHGEGAASAVALTEELLRGSPLRLKKNRAVQYFLPTFRTFDQLLARELTPEDLVRGGQSPWCVADSLALLGRSLGASAVLVDLRTGLNESTSPLLLDSRVKLVVVTTTGAQSVGGTEEILRRLQRVREPGLAPSILLTMIPRVLLQNSDVVENISEQLRQCRGDATDEPLSAGPIYQTPFVESLLSVQTLEELTAALDGTEIERRARTLAEDLLPPPPPRNVPIDLEALRGKLAETTEALTYAEQGPPETFLSVPPLQALADRFRRRAPLAVVVGPKGSGKTFTFLQLCRLGTWEGFLSKFSEPPPSAACTELIPLLSPRHLPLELRSRKQLSVVTALERAIESGNESLTWWKQFWLDSINELLDLKLTSPSAEAISGELHRQGRRLILLVDGLEERLDDIHRSVVQKSALKALLLSLPEEFGSDPDASLGLVIFVREDLVREAVTQNVGQFLASHEAYRLRWGPTEALQLVLWVCRQSGYSLTQDLKIEELALSDCVEALIPLWGRKLGTDKTNEARTSSWVLCALCDFRGQLQARDLVRFLSFAAKTSLKSAVDDRVLTPTALREAVTPAGHEKVREAVAEVPALASIFAKLQGKTMPFSDLDLSTEDVAFLEASGLVQKEGSQCYLPEILRRGLEMTLSRPGRAKVLSLTRRLVER